MSHDICRMGCCEASETAEAEIARLQRELAEAQKAWASEAEAHALAMEIIAELEEDELKLQAAYEAQLAEMRAALEEVARDAACACDAAYTSRGRHEPNAVCYLADVARAALASTPEVPDA